MPTATATETGSGTSYPIRETLQTLFGFTDFRLHQEDIVRAILDGRDVFAVMPTGGGKSMCYQLPASLLAGTCVVVSPLISLMKDQVDGLRSRDIRADYLNSSLDIERQWQVLRRLKGGGCDLLYVAPERFASSRFRQALATVPISLFAIDEAHCISEWGHDFRPDYLALSELVRQFPRVPIAAFTATATRTVQADTIRRLELRNPYTVRASFNRPNLFYEVAPKQNAYGQILDFVRRHRGESGIVYRATRRSTEETADSLTRNGAPAIAYHAGLNSEERRRRQEAFAANACPIVVATIAFGMGIDKPDVRFVIHGDLPRSIASYSQETGRAGRDGRPAHCLLLFGHGDIPKRRYWIERMTDRRQQQFAERELGRVVRFAESRRCRRRALLRHFGEVFDRENCGGCDVCRPRRMQGAPTTARPPHLYSGRFGV